MAQGGNKGTRRPKSEETRAENARDYEVKRDPDIRGVDRGRREAEQCKNPRRERNA